MWIAFSEQSSSLIMMFCWLLWLIGQIKKSEAVRNVISASISISDILQWTDIILNGCKLYGNELNDAFKKNKIELMCKNAYSYLHANSCLQANMLPNKITNQHILNS